MDLDVIGKIAFWVAVLLSIATAFVNIGIWGMYIMIALGIIVGLLNVTAKEVERYLIASLVLISSGLVLQPIIGGFGAVMMAAFITFTTVAAVIVALKAVYQIERAK